MRHRNFIAHAVPCNVEKLINIGGIMKLSLLLAIVLCGFSSFAGPITLTSAIVIKTTTNGDFGIHLNRDATEWCTGTSRGATISAFQVASTLEGMDDGIYSCDGEFMAIPGEARVSIFSLGTCTPYNDIQKSCGH